MLPYVDFPVSLAASHFAQNKTGMCSRLLLKLKSLSIICINVCLLCRFAEAGRALQHRHGPGAVHPPPLHHQRGNNNNA